MYFIKKIIALICVIAISLSCLVIPASAVDVGGVGDIVGGVADFGQWVIDTGIYGIKLVERIFNEDICPESPGGVNATHSFVPITTTKDGVLADWYVCEYCGFNSGYKVDSEGLSAAYDAYVSDLPASGYTSDGGLLFIPENHYIIVSQYNSSFSCSHFPTGSSSNFKPPLMSCSFSCSDLTCRLWPDSGKSKFWFGGITCYFDFTSPVAGYYSIASDGVALGSCVLASSSDNNDFVSRLGVSTSSFSDTYYDADVGLSYILSFSRYASGYKELSSVQVQFVRPVIKVIPLESSFGGDVYNITTRPTSITGGNYGIVGDNGQITKVEGNTIVNETNNTVWNPVTGSTSNMTDWSYDYSTRTYTVTLENGTTQTITYGDENITIQEGDTVYNVYYLVDGSGSENPPSACEHDWQKGEATVPTCTRPGSASYVCSKCQQTKTEAVPALGHTWQVKQSVTTQYDEEGNLVQQGYTIYECSVCGEQYKDEAGTGPPGGGGSTTDPGEDGETIWDKLANLAASVFGGLIGMAEAVLGKILDALTALTDMLMERLKTVVETVLSIFEELPLLFGGFLDFLGAVFPFLPPELMTLLTFGVIAIVTIGIFKAVRR